MMITLSAGNATKTCFLIGCTCKNLFTVTPLTHKTFKLNNKLLETQKKYDNSNWLTSNIF